LAEDFKEAFGEDKYEYDKGKIYKKNEDGTRGEAIDKKTAVDMLASKDASDNMEQAALNFADMFNKIDASADDSEKTYLDSMLNDRGVNALSRDEIEKL
jgi:hypothetical protein